MRHAAVVSVAAVMVVVVAGCGGGGSKATDSPFGGASRSTSDRALLVGVGEDTLDRSNPCWVNYAAVVHESDRVLSISLTARQNDAGTDCTGNAVPAYLVVTLPTPLDVTRVRDATTGRTHHIGAPINPPASELIGHLPT